MTGDVRATHIEMVEQGRGIGGVIGDAHRARRMRAPDPTALVVRDQPVVVGEHSL